MPHALESFHKVAFQTFGVNVVKVVSSEVLAGAMGFEQVIGDE
jgi:hypothetical protein